MTLKIFDLLPDYKALLDLEPGELAGKLDHIIFIMLVLKDT